MIAEEQRSPRNAVATKARILQVAQIAFSSRGYTHTSVREIAMASGVAPSLINKHFGTKRNLFAEALTQALTDAEMRIDDREAFGSKLIEALLDPSRPIMTPAMIVLSLEDEDARQVATSVARDYMIGPLTEWIDGSQPEARAAILLMLSMGFALFNRYLKMKISDEARDLAASWFAETVQGIVERPLAA